MSIGIWQVILILLIVLILFGAGKLPKVMGDVAKGVKNFRAGLKDDDTQPADQKPLEQKPDHGSQTAEPAIKRDETVRT